MLCLNRKTGQAIQVNDDVTITILEIKKNAVRLGITYGEKSRVLRHEIYMNVEAENKEAQFDGVGFELALEGIKNYVANKKKSQEEN